MVARFETGTSLSGTLNYNEKKVQKGIAQLLGAVNYPVAYDKMSFYHKLHRLENQAALNENVTRNSVHISLNFDPSESLDNQKLVDIAQTYMEQIGFGEQPYLIYRHYDSGHPHIHIVSVKVAADGRRIDTQNIGRNQSEKARKEIEIGFGLVKAEDSKLREKYRPEPVNAQKVQYGKSETKRAISNVLKYVLNSYTYSSLPELNALLELYNITIDQGTENSRMYRSGGLMYRVLDEQGNKVGAPIKASQFHMKPTLKKLQQNFTANAATKEPLKRRVKNTIDLCLLKDGNQSWYALTKALEREGISTILRQSDTGRIYGITYIDHKQKVVFNGSDLGKQYSAKAMTERTGQSQKINASKMVVDNQKTGQALSPHTQQHDENLGASTENHLANTLLQEEYTGDTLPFDLRRKKKKKKKGLSNN